jgi:DNA-binding transcriptional regulator YiaG
VSIRSLTSYPSWRMPSRDQITPAEIREVRSALHMTQEELAKQLAIPVGTLRNWEQGTQRCANPSLLRIALRCIREHARR